MAPFSNTSVGTGRWLGICYTTPKPFEPFAHEIFQTLHPPRGETDPQKNTPFLGEFDSKSTLITYDRGFRVDSTGTGTPRCLLR